MMLRDDQQKKIEKLIPGEEGERGRPAANNRHFVEAVIWIARTGSPWRDFPVEFGPWKTVYIELQVDQTRRSGRTFLQCDEKMRTGSFLVAQVRLAQRNRTHAVSENNKNASDRQAFIQCKTTRLI